MELEDDCELLELLDVDDNELLELLLDENELKDEELCELLEFEEAEDALLWSDCGQSGQQSPTIVPQSKSITAS